MVPRISLYRVSTVRNIFTAFRGKVQTTSPGLYNYPQFKEKTHKMKIQALSWQFSSFDFNHFL